MTIARIHTIEPNAITATIDGDPDTVWRLRLDDTTDLSTGDTVRLTFKAVDSEILDNVWAEYHDVVNMTASELREWADDPCSREASLSRAPIERNLRLLTTPKDEWDERDIEDAKRTIAFIVRMSAVEQGKPVSDECPLSRRDISLLNWAFDPNPLK
jgi:hypothetical protein